MPIEIDKLSTSSTKRRVLMEYPIVANKTALYNFDHHYFWYAEKTAQYQLNKTINKVLNKEYIKQPRYDIIIHDALAPPREKPICKNVSWDKVEKLRSKQIDECGDLPVQDVFHVNKELCDLIPGNMYMIYPKIIPTSFSGRLGPSSDFSFGYHFLPKTNQTAIRHLNDECVVIRTPTVALLLAQGKFKNSCKFLINQTIAYSYGEDTVALRKHIKPINTDQ